MKMNSYFFRIFFVLVFMLSMEACDGQRPIRIGFVAGLTGKHSELGISGRNGVMLAVEEKNREGGVQGRSIVLSIKDDKQDEDQAVFVVNELIEEKVVAIIGHMTSQMSVQTAPIVTQEQLLMISPTTATNALVGKDDFFIRVSMPTEKQIDRLVDFSINYLNVRTIAVVYDASNEAYSKDFYIGFDQVYKEKKLGTVTPIPYNSMQNVSFSTIADQLISINPDGVLVVAGSLDAALVCQNLRKKNYRGVILSSPWGMTNDFIEHGGRYVEGVYFVHWFYSTAPGAAFEKVRSNYRNRFGSEIDFAASMAYESAHLLFDALKKAADGPEIKEAILSQGGFEGLQGEVTFDSFGDPDRQTYLLEVKDAQIVEVKLSDAK